MNISVSDVNQNSNLAEGEQNQPPQLPLRTPWWVRILPYFLSAFFFLSAIFAVFAPLPLLFLDVKKGRLATAFACLTNTLWVGLASWFLMDRTKIVLSMGPYLIFVILLTLVLTEMIRRKKSLERTVGISLILTCAVGVVFWFGYSKIYHFDLTQELKQQISMVVEYATHSDPAGTNLVSPLDLEEWKRSVLIEFPSAVAIFTLIVVWTNLLLLLRTNPNRIREYLGLEPSFFKKWKAPEHLVWPTVLSGAFLVVDLGVYSDVALNIFKFLMAVYAIQGLSILNYFFDFWSIRTSLRMIGYCIAIFFMLPLVLILGFFDLWFDFRSKLRQP